MLLSFRHIAIVSAAVCFSLCAASLLAPALLPTIWGIDHSYVVGLLGRRSGALFLAIGVMFFLARNAAPSPARSALSIGFIVGCSALALLGLFELFSGHVGLGILVAVAVEVVLALGLFMVLHREVGALMVSQPDNSSSLPASVRLDHKHPECGETMSNQPKFGAVLFAKNLPLVAEFYAELVSLEIVLAERDLIVLESAAFQLVVHAIPMEVAESLTITSPPQRRVDVPTKLIFPVKSIADTRTKAAELGGSVDAKEQEWEAAQFRACDGYDPEGNVVQFRERAS